MSLNAHVVRGLKWTAGARIAGQVLTWGITIFVMRLLAPADYGLVAMATAASSLLGILAEFGLGLALVRTPDVSVQKLRQAMGVSLMINGGLCVAQCIAAPFIAAFYSEPRLTVILYVMSLQFLLVPLGMISEVQLQRQLEYKRLSLSELSSAVCASLGTLALAVSGAGVWSLVLGNLGGVVCRTLMLNLSAPFPYFPLFSFKDMRTLLSFGSKTTLSRCLWMLYIQVDVMIIGRVLGGRALGVYSVSLHLATLPVQRVTAILNQVAFPALARFQDQRELIRQQLLKVFGLLSLAAFPISWGMSSTANEIVLVLLGQNWMEAAFPLQTLTLIMPFRTVVGFLPTVTDAIGRPEIGLRNVIVYWLIMPPAFYVGCQWGITGVALAWLLVYPVALLINAHRMLAAVELSLMSVAMRMAPAAASAAAMFLAVEALRQAMLGRVPPMAMLMSEIALGALVYCAATWTINRATLQEALQILRRGK